MNKTNENKKNVESKVSNFASFLKSKGFIYPSSEIYGGVSGLYDYGHLGTLLKKNFENLWRIYFLELDDNFYEIETANIMHEDVFKASGHLENFTDPIVKCLRCGNVKRADHLVEEKLNKRVEELTNEELTALIKEHKLKCDECGGNFSNVTDLNMMFPVKIGVGKKDNVYLRSETAQSPYVNFKCQFDILRKKLPMGLGLVGRAYRNEISPRNLTLRQREFTQAELQIFFNSEKIDEHPDFESIKDYKIRTMLLVDRGGGNIVERSASELVGEGYPKFYIYYLAIAQKFYFEKLNIPKEKFRCYELNESEKAFYNKYHFDLEIDLSEHGFTEVGGLHYRTDHDLRGHQDVSGESMEVMDDTTGKKTLPHVLEISLGVDRNLYALLDIAFREDEERGNIVLNLSYFISPIKVAILPLVKKLSERAEKVYKELSKEFKCFYDKQGSIGKRYARQDEIGTPICLTVDFENEEEGTVTLRDRDSAGQIRILSKDIKEVLRKILNREADFFSLGEEVD